MPLTKNYGVASRDGTKLILRTIVSVNISDARAYRDFNRNPGKSIRAVGGSVELARPQSKIRPYVGPSKNT